MNKSEECTIFTSQLRGCHSNLHCNFISWLYWAWNHWGHSFQVVSICLNEEGIHWPGSFSIISESPGFFKLFIWLYFVSVTKVFFDKSGIVNYFLLSFSSSNAWISLTRGLVHLRSFLLLLSRVRTLNESWSMIGFSNFKHGMSMAFFSFTFLAEVEVWTDTALISNSLDWSCIAAITYYSWMNFHFLVSSFLAEIISNHSLESLSSIWFYFLSKNLNQTLVKAALEFSCTIASSTRKSSFVDLWSIASEANQLAVIVVNLLLFWLV